MLLLAMGLAWPVAGLGCATALNVQDASLRKPYGGVTMPITEFFGGTDSGDTAEYASAFFFPVWLCDKPLSLVADTLTLPYILYARRTSPPAPNYRPPLSFPAGADIGSTAAK